MSDDTRVPVAPANVNERNAKTATAALVSVSLVALIVALPPAQEIFKSAGILAPGLFAMAIVFPAMIACEMILFKPWRDCYDFSEKRAFNFHAVRRCIVRFVAHSACLFLLALFYAAAAFSDKNFLSFFFLFFPVALIAPLPHFWLMEKFGKVGSSDEFLSAGQSMINWFFKRLLGRDKAAPFVLQDPHVRNLIKTYLIKGIFIPTMVLSALAGWRFWREKGGALFTQAWFAGSGLPDVAMDFGVIYEALIVLVVAVDTTVGTIGYISSSKLLGTQVTKTDSTWSGWLVALACYPPFAKLFEVKGLAAVETIWPQEFARQYPLASILCCVFVLAMWVIFTWATFVFGLRFSNLTNRGTITIGPYAIVRHPAYSSKTIAWWITLAPVAILNPSILPWAGPALALITAIYVARALTEEVNMSYDPNYEIYRQKVRWRFIPWVI